MGTKILFILVSIGWIGGTIHPLFAASKPDGMIFVPGGGYRPLYSSDRSNNKKKSQSNRLISVGPFYLDKFPVRLKDYISFLEKNTQWRKSQVKRMKADGTYLSRWKDDVTPPIEYNFDAPITEVSWFAARAYCNSLKKRLPNLDEWEYAASLFSSKSDYKKKILDWYAEPSKGELPPVGSTFANQLGIYDLHGLIWEWVEDFNSSLVTGESRADASLERSMFCGSSGMGSSDFEDYASFMRFGFRSSLRGNFTLKNLGFRCAKSIKSSEDVNEIP